MRITKKIENDISNLTTPESKLQYLSFLYLHGTDESTCAYYFNCDVSFVIKALIDVGIYNFKYCTLCDEIKHNDDFYYDLRMSRLLSSDCKKCRCLNSKEYHNKNRKDRNTQMRNYHKLNREKNLQRMHDWYLNKIEQNPEFNQHRYDKFKSNQIEYHKEYYNNIDNQNKRKEYLSKYNQRDYVIDERNKKFRENYHNDIQFRLKTTIGNYIRAALKDGKQGLMWEDILGYTVNDLICHFDKLFQPGMGWDNYGDWHIDHIRPISSFNFTSYDDDDFKKCWSLNNLQPLWAADNLAKSNKII